MAKVIIDLDLIREHLDITEDFKTIKEFCDFLVENEKDTNIKLSLKRLLTDVLRDDKEEKQAVRKRLFKQNIEWIEENCVLQGEKYDKEDSKISIQNQSTQMNSKIEVVKSEMDFNKVKNYFEEEEYRKIIPLADDELDYTEGIILHEGGIITQQNDIQIYLSKPELIIDPSKILIVEAEGNRVLALGYLVKKDEETYTVVVNNKNFINYSAFLGIGQARFIIYDVNQQPYSRYIEIDYKPFKVENERPLCIDFGTSNTAVGSYGIKDRQKDKAEIVEFIDVTVTPNNIEAKLLPTIVYVEDCSDPMNIKYLFGYEARKKIEEEHYESKASVFYEIKRWLSCANEIELIRDNNNNKATPKKKEIIKAYIDYVIENAEQYFGTRFKKIHFSAPVKLKDPFLKTFAELYKGEKEVLSANESIDEGIAIVYNQIITLLYARDINEKQNESKSIMIMDCGGGTTDLASCEYSYQKTDAGMVLKLTTGFENGNANFGGNNITYRIMQLLKIKIAAALCKNSNDNNDNNNIGDAISLINKSENEILGLVESENKKNRSYDSDKTNSEIYKKFLEKYQDAEAIIPTQYEGNEKYKGAQQIKMIKRNFYYLWRQAEQIKIEFYKTEKVLMDFKDESPDTPIYIRNLDNYYLYVVDEESGKLRKELRPLENIKITIKEINRVICGDIYSLLVGLFQDGEFTLKQLQDGKIISEKKKVEDFNYYKLSGQSCKISLFSELIKEYIPGRKFRPAIEKGGSTEKRNSEDLKLDCIYGSINYMKDQLRPEMQVITHSTQPEIIYNIYLKGTHNNDKLVFDCNNYNDIQIEVSHKNTKEYPFKIIGKDNICEKEFIFQLKDPGKDEDWTTEEIKAKIKHESIINEQGLEKFIEKLTTLVKENKETINMIFMVPAKQGYGVWIGQIQAYSTEDGAKYKLLKFDYENFEDSSKTFFDGRR